MNPLSADMTAFDAWVWTAAADRRIDGLMERCERWLLEQERKRLARLAFEDDRLAYASAHALLRWSLQLVTGIPSAQQSFATNEFGRPQWAAEHEPAVLPSFNLSHARGFVAVAVGRSSSVGVDVEAFGPRWSERTALAFDVLTRREAEWISRESEPKRRGERFLRVWTLKEALVKAVGRGVGLALDSFELQVDPPKLLTGPTALLPEGRWRLEQWRVDDRGWVALAIDEPIGQPMMIRRHHFDTVSLLAALDSDR